MENKLILGSIIAVVLLILVSIAPSINANVSKTDKDILLDENSTPIALVFQLITKLRNHPNIQNVENEDDVLQIIDSDAELNDIFVKLKSNDCGCEDSSSDLNWRFPIFCWNFFLILLVLDTFGLMILGILPTIWYIICY